MTIGDALIEGLQVTVIGLTIVFAVLLILMFVLMAFKALFYKDSAKEAEQQSETESTLSAAADAEASPNPNTVSENDGELVAVITAAIAASLSTSTYNLNIRSYRRIGNASPEWNKAGIEDVIKSTY